MRIAVTGTGGVGGYFGARLAKGGHDEQGARQIEPLVGEDTAVARAAALGTDVPANRAVADILPRHAAGAPA
ncbi:hypothetical protein [Pseudonocardia sp. N23]|uniref:hypothetical protein n=1 Tax=Pseudonocardia sp. N23 TaxID=1987376 RepID=UPI000C0347AB|nr:hypothetical protein [Pseudonocardia sp. N23]GAY10442.1 hypothetical protein TOK_4803 [Pseudonocardia sp. N23]